MASLEQARALTPLATEFRYPGDVMEPTMEQAILALAQARDIHTYVVRLVEPHLQPPFST